MNKTLLVLCIVSVWLFSAKAGFTTPEFDSIQFNNSLLKANYLAEYEYFTLTVTDSLSQTSGQSDSEWFSYKEQNNWYIIGGKVTDGSFKILKHVKVEPDFNTSEYTGPCDTLKLKASGNALSAANSKFQVVRDTSNFYFLSFVYINPDQTVSVWFLPAFQPSGQAIYGCEWEYVFDKTGKKPLKINSYVSNVTGVWIGRPRELWLNYRNSGTATVGSLFFALSFRDYFTRLRIDTRISTSTTARDSEGNYQWEHKIK